MRVRRAAGAVLAILISGVLFAPLAHAEGSWNSSFYNIVSGFKTRTWEDSNSDSLTTRLTIQKCYQVNGNDFGKLRWELRLGRNLRPDLTYGERENDCRGRTGVTVWAQPEKGTYHLRYNGTTSGPPQYYATDSINVRY